jgi:hypothetical protein
MACSVPAWFAHCVAVAASIGRHGDGRRAAAAAASQAQEEKEMVVACVKGREIRERERGWVDQLGLLGLLGWTKYLSIRR